MPSWLIENGNLEAVQRSNGVIARTKVIHIISTSLYIYICAKVRDGKHEYRKVTCECSKKEIQESSCKSFALFIVKLYL